MGKNSRKYDVFISYSRKDTTIVDQFVKRLTEAGYRVWIDRDGIYSGDQFATNIVEAIENLYRYSYCRQT